MTVPEPIRSQPASCSRCTDCDRLRAELERERSRFHALSIDFENAQTDLIAKRRQVAALQREINRQAGVEKFDNEVQLVFNYWRRVCNHPRAKLGEKRRKVLLARLREGFTVAQLQAAVDGASVGAFVKDGRRYDDLELICRDEVKLESFIARWEHAPPPLRFPDSAQHGLVDGIDELCFYLTMRFGPTYREGDVERYGCPSCEGPGMPLHVQGRSVRCNSCHAGFRDVSEALYRPHLKESS